MPAERFYVDDDLIDGARVEMDGPELHHLAHVMRVEVGEAVELVNGRGALAKAGVTTIGKKSAVLKILSSSHTQVPSPQLILAIPFMRPAKLEWVIEKGTELGADLFRLYPAEYSEKTDLSQNQLERLKYIAVSAMKQSGRLDLPPLEIVKRFSDLFPFTGTTLFGHTDPEAPLLWKTESPPSIQFITGPERGFSNKELTLLHKNGKGVRLHKNILRAETAPLAAAALLHL